MHREQRDPESDVVRDALGLLQSYFGRMTAEEADAFTLGYWAGVLALHEWTVSEGKLSAGELAAHVDANFLRCIRAERLGRSVSLSDLQAPPDAGALKKRKSAKKH